MRNILNRPELTLKSSLNTSIFTIENVIYPLGGSCIAYYVSYKESSEIVHHGILKEYCPAFLANTDINTRNVDGSLNVPDEYKDIFRNGLDEFKNTYKKINKYLYNTPSASNYHPVQLGLYEGNNTAYTLTSCDYGKNYDEIDDDNLLSVLKIMLSVTKAVELYHNAGFLHLDIKPKNVLVLDGISDLVKLFDYDSLTSIEHIKSKTVRQIPIPEDYYVPELVNAKVRDIGIKTDIFEIGAMLFKKIFKKAPKLEDMSYDSVFVFEDVVLLSGVSPKAKYELEQIFRNTIQISPKKRYETTKELISAIENLISIVESKTPYLVNLPKWSPSRYCIGRNNELTELKSRLNSSDYVFIKAMGGTGKSELAKMFAQAYESEYHTVQFCKYTGSLKSLVLSIKIKGINNNDYTNIDELANEKNKILHSSDCHTLIIVDNFNVTYDEYLREFLPAAGGFKVIFTTRCMPANDYYFDKVFELSVLSEKAALALFYNHSRVSKSIENDNLIKEILETIQYNTLILILIAQTISKPGMNLTYVLQKLKESHIDEINGDIFHEYDFSSIDGENYNKIFAHLNTIFNISSLTSIQKEILKDMSIVPYTGISIDVFIEFAESDSITQRIIYDLYSLGWLEMYDEDVISVHPIISDLMDANESVPKAESYNKLANNLIFICTDNEYEHIDDINLSYSLLSQLDKRFKKESSFINIDIKLLFAKTLLSLYDGKSSKKKYEESNELIKKSFRFKPRYCISYFGLANVEKTFGNANKAIELYKKAIHYCKTTVNYFYEIHFEAICGIASCCENMHDYKNAYKYYLEAYSYTQSENLKEKLNRIIFSTDACGTKMLDESIPCLCDNIIEVCKELEMYEQMQKFQEIKEAAVSRIHREINEEIAEKIYSAEDAEKHLENAKELIAKGNLKDCLREISEYLDFTKEAFGEESPVYIENFSEILPLLISANSDNGEISISALDGCIEFFKDKFGENSMRFAEYLILVSEALMETRESEFSENLAEKAKQICVNLNQKNSFAYQEANLVIIGSLIIQCKIDKLRDVVDEIDFDMFKSKSDYEKLVKYAGMALVELGEYDKAINIAKKLIEKQNISPVVACVTCAVIVESFLQQGNPDEALIYLKKEKPFLDMLDDSLQKNEHSALYYCGYAWVQSYYENYENYGEAISTLDNCIENLNIDNEYISRIYVCRAYTIKARTYRNALDFINGLKCISKVESYVNDEITPLKFKIEILDNLSACYVANGRIEKGIKYFTQLESLCEEINVYNSEIMFMRLVYFVDALLVGGSYEACRYIKKAEKLVDLLNLYDSMYNARLQNSLGVYLSDYENRNALALEKCKQAKEIIEKNNADDTPLYRQVLKNIDYLNDLIQKEIIQDMAKAMIEQNEQDDTEENGNE